ALAGDRQVEIATGKFLGAVLIEVLGHFLHFHATGLATGIDGSQFRAAGLEAGCRDVGDVLGNDVQRLISGAQATQANVVAHERPPRNSLMEKRERLPTPDTCRSTSPPLPGTLTRSTTRFR